MAYEYITKYDSPNHGGFGVKNHPREIVVHHWGEEGQKFTGVLNWLCDPRSQVSAHFVLEDGKVACIVNLDEPAWHAGSRKHNTESIGIECRPECTDGDVNTLIELIANLYKIYGVLPVVGHRDIASTACPGKYYSKLGYIQQKATELYKTGKYELNKPTSAPKPVASKKPSRAIADVYNPKTPLTAKQAVKAGQAISNIILGTNIAEDGIDGPDTRANRVRMMQWAMNKDYFVGIAVDGKEGTDTRGALGYHTVRQGETQYMVTALEVLLLMNGYNPHGVEIPGQFGSGLGQCVLAYQMDHSNLTNDRIAGRDTFLQLIK